MQAIGCLIDTRDKFILVIPAGLYLPDPNFLPWSQGHFLSPPHMGSYVFLFLSVHLSPGLDMTEIIVLTFDLILAGVKVNLNLKNT